MIGIYKIENSINGKSYIGQSVNIEKRWSDHKYYALHESQECSKYPLYRAIRKYGLENFKFEIIEECSVEMLNKKEEYWIEQYDTWANGYNQTRGGDKGGGWSKLQPKEVYEIQEALINFHDDIDTRRIIADKYNVSTDTIQAINAGRAWIRDDLQYPLHKSKYRSGNRCVNLCIDCHIPVSRGAKRCLQCERINRLKKVNTCKEAYTYNDDGSQTYVISSKGNRITRRELKKLIREKSFLQVGKYFDVTDNTIRKWCSKLNLPTKRKEIKALSDSEWENI